ncbi:hypothetical protein CDD83_7571 [Cordyceps sp. RAO-2017]|nr:hypothetical protein CDD83_7571 [Cordyceps sp. RAO-2017]
MTVDDVPDSTDWLSTPLSGLAAVEAALRCQVCKDFFKTPMITSCSHTFCSLCIRRALSSDGKCPLCRAPEQELKLRSNWSIEDAVETFARARTDMLALARNRFAESTSQKRKVDVEESPEPQPKRLRASTRLSKARASTAAQLRDDVVENSDEDEDYVPDDPDGLVPCPACQTKMKAWRVFQHLETCPGPSPRRQANRRDENTAGEDSTAYTSGQVLRRQDKSLERLPALNYSMLKEQTLRKKMTELGISNQGPRQLLEKRHKEWLTLWNANCDAAHPKKRIGLLHDLEVWERTQGGRAPTTGKAIQAAAAVRDKDFDAAAWAVKHDSSFKDLIAAARKSKLETKIRTGERGGGAALGQQTVMGAEAARVTHTSSLLSPAECHDSTRSSVNLGKPIQPDPDAASQPGTPPDGSSNPTALIAKSPDDPRSSQPTLGAQDAIS